MEHGFSDPTNMGLRRFFGRLGPNPGIDQPYMPKNATHVTGIHTIYLLI